MIGTYDHDRPRVDDLTLRLYDRPLHPEFFDVVASQRIDRPHYSLTVLVTPTGHVFEWGNRRSHVVEVTTAEGRDLPEYGRRMTHPFAGERSGRCRLADGARYHVCLQVERLDPDLFVLVHGELLALGAKAGVLVGFRSPQTVGLNPLSLVTVDSVRLGVAVSAFHTFPDEFTIIKTQSLIEFEY
ncbi:MAG TPA: DUF2617 family protein [Fimbriiglobus sp.]|jgi:hypothetical protein